MFNFLTILLLTLLYATNWLQVIVVDPSQVPHLLTNKSCSPLFMDSIVLILLEYFHENEKKISIKWPVRQADLKSGPSIFR